MNSIVRDYLPARYFAEYQALRDQLMELLTDEDLGTRLGGETMSLGEICREMGEVERSYVDSLETFRQDWQYRNDDPRMETSVSALRDWYRDMDRELMETIRALSEHDIADRRIVRSDFPELLPQVAFQLDQYRECLVIFSGKASVYQRALGKPFPEQWRTWIG